MSDLIERLRDKARLRAAHGLTGWVLAEEALLAQAADEIERLTAEQQHEAEQVPSLKRTIRDLCAERDELRRQLAEAEQDARRYRWLRNEANTARKCDPMVCIYPLDEQDLIDGDRLDVAIDAAMGASNE